MMTLTGWEDWLTVGVLVAGTAGAVSFLKNLGTVYVWIIDVKTYIRSRSLKSRVTDIEEFMWHYFDLKGDAVWMTGRTKSGNYGAVRVSLALCDLVGLTDTQITDGDGEGWASALHPQYKWVLESWNQCIEEKRIFRERWAFKHRNGKIVYVEGYFRPSFNKDEFKGGFGSLTEITDEKEIAEIRRGEKNKG